MNQQCLGLELKYIFLTFECLFDNISVKRCMLVPNGQMPLKPEQILWFFKKFFKLDTEMNQQQMKSQSTDLLNSLQWTQQIKWQFYTVWTFTTEQSLYLLCKQACLTLQATKDSALAIPTSDNPNRSTEVFHNWQNCLIMGRKITFILLWTAVFSPCPAALIFSEVCVIRLDL